MNKKMILVFQRYEIDLILSALNGLRREDNKWERQPLTGEFGYTLNQKIKQIDFVINSINRQLDIISKMDDENLCL